MINHIRLIRAVVSFLALALLFRSTTFALSMPLAQKPRLPAFVLSPSVTEKFKPGEQLTLTSTAKKKMPWVLV
jgi:hypothetical protein